MSAVSSRRLAFLLLVPLAAFTAWGARTDVCWNDASRLASVEAIADHGSLALDGTHFAGLTSDKILVEGRYYSDKPYVFSFYLAGVYKAVRSLGFPAAAEQPEQFARLMVVASSVPAYLLAVWCVFALGGTLGLSPGWRLVWAGSFAFATFSLAYTRAVNNHVVFLAVACALFLHLVQLAEEARQGSPRGWRLALVGGLTGFGYTLDQGAGPVLLLCVPPLVLYRCRRIGPVAVFVLGVVPLVLAHHAVNYAIGGTLKPANSVAEYLNWPGSPFSTENMTGVWRHSPLHFVKYALGMLFGRRGFVGHNLPLYLLPGALLLLLRWRRPERPEVAMGAAWFVGTWVLYAAMSNNYSGACVSIRWFVPLLAPAWLVMGLLIRDYPQYRGVFLVLSGWGVVLSAIMWIVGPWTVKLVPLFWPIQGAALVSCAGWWGRRKSPEVEQMDERPPARAA